MTRYLLLLQYDGTDFCGWQRQKNGVSVQETVERALKTALSTEATVTGSGRTDAGVSAAGQVAHFDAELTLPPEKIAKALNGVLPPSVRVLQSGIAPQGFHARFSAKKKTYVYTFYTAESELPLVARFASREAVLPLAGKTAAMAEQRVKTPESGMTEEKDRMEKQGDLSRQEGRALDFSAMERAAKTLLGTHDFAAFSSTGSDVKDTVRTVYRSELKKQDIPREVGGGTLYRYTVTGSGFLYHMVRIIAGTLVAIGNRQRDEEVFLRAFQTGNRKDLGKTAPAAGLTLLSVEYRAEDEAR